MELARRICALAGVPESLIAFVADRPGHDFRYGLRSDRLRALGWEPRVAFDDGLALTVDWYRDHLDWLRQRARRPVVTEPRGGRGGSMRLVVTGAGGGLGRAFLRAAPPITRSTRSRTTSSTSATRMR